MSTLGLFCGSPNNRHKYAADTEFQEDSFKSISGAAKMILNNSKSIMMRVAHILHKTAFLL